MAHEEPPSSPLSDAPSDLSALLFTPKKPQVNGDTRHGDNGGTTRGELVSQGPAEHPPSGSLVKQEVMPEIQRPSRKRLAPKKFAEEIDSPPKKKRPSPRRTSSLAEDGCSIASASSSPTGHPSKRKQPLRGDWSVQHLMSSAKSKLVTANLSAILHDDRAWTSLTREQQEKLISMLPGASVPQMPEGEPLPNVAKMFLQEHASFQASIRQFQDDLDAGKYEAKWLEDAQKAMQKRAGGEFDKWKEDQREQFWGQKQKIDWTAKAGESSQHELPTLVKAGYVKIGDVWHLRRAHGRGHDVVVVQKEATVCSANGVPVQCELPLTTLRRSLASRLSTCCLSDSRLVSKSFNRMERPWRTISR